MGPWPSTKSLKGFQQVAACPEGLVPRPIPEAAWGVQRADVDPRRRGGSYCTSPLPSPAPGPGAWFFPVLQAIWPAFAGIQLRRCSMKAPKYMKERARLHSSKTVLTDTRRAGLDPGSSVLRPAPEGPHSLGGGEGRGCRHYRRGRVCLGCGCVGEGEVSLASRFLA